MILAALALAMKQRLWLIFAALILIAGGVMLQYRPERLAVAAPVEQPRPDVRIQHEFVRVSTAGIVSARSTPGAVRRAAEMETNPIPDSPDPIVAERPAFVQLAPASPSTAEPAPRRAPVVQRATSRDDRTLFEKARRAFVGDGRYRPEPVPRVRDNN